MKIINAMLAALTIVLTSAVSATAKSCDSDNFHSLCNGCSVDLNWKMRRFDKKEVKRWCVYTINPRITAISGFQIVKGFSLGETRTSTTNFRVSALRTGRDKLTVRMLGTDRYGKPYSSIINFNVEVVEGEF